MPFEPASMNGISFTIQQKKRSITKKKYGLNSLNIGIFAMYYRIDRNLPNFFYSTSKEILKSLYIFVYVRFC